MQISGAIFDMDGTLVDSLGYWNVFWSELGEEFAGDSGFRPDPETDRAIRTLPLREAMHLLHEKTGFGVDGDALWQLADRRCARFYAEEVQMKPGALEFLALLRDRGVPMCIASATAPSLLRIVIEKYRLDAYLPRLFSCSEIGRGKEHPDIFLLAHEFLGTPKASTWVFEDSPLALETAQAAGFPTVGVFDANNFDPDRARAASVHYIGDRETLMGLASKI
ncbi:MAG: HAD family phosphatase [Clostridia bacterium]|nr:HAD family phosphatase [Clostridia bacterium]